MGPFRNSFAVQWLGPRLYAYTAGGTGLRTKIPHAGQRGQENKDGNFHKLIEDIFILKKTKAPHIGISLVAQWLRVHCQCRGHGFEPWSGKIPHAAEQLSPCATTTEPVL